MEWWQYVGLFVLWLIAWAITGYVQGAAKALGFNDWVDRK